MKPMLACKFDEKYVQLPIMAQPKLDGIRLLIRDGISWTRSLKPLRSSWVQSWVAHNREVLEGIDCEIITGDPLAPDAYRRTSSAVMSYDNQDALNSKLYIFDQWDLPAVYQDRYDYLQERFSKNEFPEFCSLLETRMLWKISEVYEYEAELLNQKHEGVILRNPNGMYKFGRSTPREGSLIKMKQFLDTEAIIIGYKELLHNENEQTTNVLGYAERSGHKENLVPGGVLGSLIARGVWEGGGEYEIDIGSGFDAEDRRFLWAGRESLIGKIVKFKYFPGGVKDSPRFPIFLGFRDADDLSPKSEPQQMSLF